MVDKNKAREAIELLVEKYQRVLSSDNIKSYTEETAKKDFILPLFEALGWDVYNKYTEDEVTAEEKVSKGRVDYAFRINGIPKLFVEAKSLKADLKKFSDRRYEQAQKTMIIIAGMIKRLECYLDEGQYLAGKSTTIVMPTKIEPKLLLAILNSKLMTFVYKNLFKSLSLAGGYMRVGSPQIKNLPVRIISEIQQEPVVKLVDKMLSLNERLDEIGDKLTDERTRIEEEIKKIDTEIDELVYEIYGITDEEKKIIEAS